MKEAGCVHLWVYLSVLVMCICVSVHVCLYVRVWFRVKGAGSGGRSLLPTHAWICTITFHVSYSGNDYAMLLVIICTEMKGEVLKWGETRRWKHCKYCGFSSSSSLIRFFTPPMLFPPFFIPSSIRSSGYPQSICRSAFKDKTHSPRSGSVSIKDKGGFIPGCKLSNKLESVSTSFFIFTTCAFCRDYFCLMWWSYR